MTIFMGLLFYKVASGLCLYFIASSLWGIAERKLLPKATPPGDCSRRRRDHRRVAGSKRQGAEQRRQTGSERQSRPERLVQAEAKEVAENLGRSAGASESARAAICGMLVSMPYHPDDTICAIATAPGGAARGMVRVSGPDAVCRCVDNSFERMAVSRSIGCVSRPSVRGEVRVELDDDAPSSCRAICLSGRRAQLHAPAGGGAAHIWFAAASRSLVATLARPALGWPSRANSRCAHFWRAGSI